MNVSPDFSLPLRWIAPYFLSAAIFYTVSMGFLFFLDPTTLFDDFRIVGWVHAYMIGFVMMVIIGAMGQLSVVVAEVHHRYPALFGWIWPLVGIGTVILMAGFYRFPLLLLVGGGVIVSGLALFAFNLFITLRTSRRRTSVTRSMQWSTLFLGIGLGLGLMMASGYAGLSSIDPSQWKLGHIVALFGGYVMLNIMGVSTVLLPMFGACNRPADNDYTVSFYTMAVSVITMIIAVMMQMPLLITLSLVTGTLSIIYYMYRVYRIFISKKRKYSDIWERSVAVAFMALAGSISSGIYGYFTEDETTIVLAFGWLTVGFLGFLISAHLYKIIPFLVWFERYAPFVDEWEVPMLHQLLPVRWADWQWATAIGGIMVMTAAIVTENTVLWNFGALLLCGSGVLLLAVILKILRHKL
ncbi:MAG: hypothetical protein PHW64_06980 [Sulfuricurvum sp.]|nr:hypothetical protein [Sulfuricurvum sp.]